MKWGFLTVIILGLALLFGAPFLDFLAPSENMTLAMFNPNTQKYTILTTGAETLWFQWQSWAYLFAFGFSLSLVLGSIYHMIRQLSDNSLIEAQQKLTKKTKEMEKLKCEYRSQVEMEVQHTHAQKSEQLNKRRHELDTIQRQTTELHIESQERMKRANHAVLSQQKETQSKLGQRDRLRDEKKLIAEYLERSHWTLSDGTKVTYNVLKKLAKKAKQP